MKDPCSQEKTKGRGASEGRAIMQEKKKPIEDEDLARRKKRNH